MKKKTRYKLKLLDVLVILVCFGISIASILLFWNDINRTTTRNDKDQIATITFKHKIAQRKFSDRVVWERLSNESPLYNLDTIRTADLSDAKITFQDGTVLELHENTMLQIAYNKEGVKLSVGGGDVVVDASKSDNQVQIKMDNGSAINLSAGSKLTAKADSQSGEANFQLQSGSGTVRSEDGTSQIVGTGESVKLFNNGQVKKGGITVTSISSDVKVLNFEREFVPVHLEWNAGEDLADSKILVETSKSKDFSKVEKIYERTGSSSIDLPAEDGVLYWRVYAVDEKEAPVSGKLKVENIDNVEIKTPSNGLVYKYRNDLPQVKFSWLGNEYADHYKLQIGTSADFTSVLLDQDVSVQSLILNQFEEGTYYWRVIPYYSLNDIGYGESTEVRSFIIERKQEISPPVLTLPVEKAKVIYAQKEYQTNFQWKSEVKDALYKIVVASDRDFSNIVYENETTKNRYQATFTTDNISDGIYYWKVLRESEEDEIVKSSDVRSFTVSKYIPAVNRLIYPPQNYSIEESKLNKISFQWGLGDEYKNQKIESVIQFSKNENFAEVKEYRTDGTDIKNIQLSETGKYFWRLGVYDSIANEFNYTDVRILNVLKEFGTPDILYPPKDFVHLVQKNKPVTIRWNKISDADYYHVCIFDDAGNLVAENPEVKGTSIGFDLKLNENDKISKKNLKVTVQAIGEETDSSSMRISKLGIGTFAIRNPKKVLLNSPENKKRYDGLDVLRNPVSLDWRIQEDIPDYSQFVLRKVSASGNTKIVETIDNPSKTIYLERLTEGTYEWTVKAGTKDGYNLDAIGYNTFIVGPVPELDKAVLVEPSNDFVIENSYLKKHRNISFDWNMVNGATDYMFVLYQITEEGLKKVYSESTKEPAVKIKDLSILDVGDFEWQVTAYSHAKDGFEEQHSKTAAGKFKIDIKKPKKVQIKDPGRLYGD